MVYPSACCVSAVQVILADDCLAGLLAYLNDYAHMAMTCRSLYHSALYIDLYGYWLEQLQEMHLNVVMQSHEEHSASIDMVMMCETCGIRPGVEWLGYSECFQCYEDHTD